MGAMACLMSEILQIREDFIRVLRYFCLFYGEESTIAKQATEVSSECEISYVIFEIKGPPSRILLVI